MTEMDTSFYSEVKRQPQSIRNTVGKYQKNGFELLHQAAQAISSAQAVTMCGMGTSYNVCFAVLESFNRKSRVNAVQAYQLLNTDYAGVKDGDLLILISQSGESGEIVRICREREGRNQIIAITNDTGSSLAQAAKFVLPLYCDEEKSITNCTFTASLAVLAMLSAAVNGENVEACAAKLCEGSSLAEAALSDEEAVFSLADLLATTDRVHFIGRNGTEMALVEQAALTFKEGADCNAQAFNVGSFRHGPMELCSHGHFALLYASDGKSISVMDELREKMEKNGSTAIMISALPCSTRGIFIPAENAETYSMAAAVINEMLLIRAAQNRGREAGIFKIAGKICRES